MLHEVQMGKRTRKSFSRIAASEKISDLIEIQKDSFQNFIATELSSIIKDFSPIDDFSQNMQLEFLTCYLEGVDGKPVVVATSCLGIFDEYLSNHQNLDRDITGRLVIR